MQAVLLDIVLDIRGRNLEGCDPIEILTSDTVILADKQAPNTVQMWRLQVFDNISEP